MTTAPPEPKPARRGLWLSVVVVVGLLALTTWDVLRNSGGSSPAALRRAAFDGDEATVRRLISAHPEWIDSVGSTNGRTRVLGSLYDKAMTALGKPTPTGSFGVPEIQFKQLESLGATPLLHAMEHNQVGTALVLIEAGANVRARSLSGMSPLHAALFHGDTNLFFAIEKRGARLDTVDPVSGWTPLHHASFSQRPEVLQLLIGRGYPINATNRGGVGPLHIAAGRARLDLVQVLATNGADLTLVNGRGNTALEEARRRALMTSNSNATAVVTWLETFAATNQPLAKPVP